MTYQSDRYGFSNAESAFNEKPLIDLLPVIAALPDPMAVSSTPRTHCNECGYEPVAREVASTYALRAGL